MNTKTAAVKMGEGMNTKTAAVKISQFEVENVKRVKAISYDCAGKTLTVIGGGNGQGKTSLLDAIMWTLGGDRYKPSNPIREGADKVATRVELSNGVIVERKGVGGALKVTSPDGRGGQQLLNEFISAFALDLPKFMEATSTEKARMLLDCFPGLGEKLQGLNEESKRLYDERHALGQIVTRKKKHAEDLPYHADVPAELLTGTQMTQKLQDCLRKNAENDRLRKEVNVIRISRDSSASRVTALKRQLEEAETKLGTLNEQLDRAVSSAANLKDEDTSSLSRELEQIDAINAKVRTNLDKARAEAESEELARQYGEISGKLDEVRAERFRLLSTVDMPLSDLSINDDGELLYRAAKWDGMSGAEQLRVAVAICAAVKPDCGFVLIDGMERMDLAQLREFSAWLDERDLQAIGTRVSTGDECSIVIEDGAAITSDEPSFTF